MSGAASRDVGCGAVFCNCTDHKLAKGVVEENSHTEVLIMTENQGMIDMMLGVGLFVVTMQIMNYLRLLCRRTPILRS